MKLDVKLTDAGARALKLPRGRTDEVFWDGVLAGFGCRVYATGVRSWFLQYDHGKGSTRKLTLGSIDFMSAGRARGLAMDLLARVRLGEDPVADKRGARADDAMTFAATLPRYLAFKRSELRPGSFSEVERHLSTHAAPLHRRRLADIDRKMVAGLLSKIAADAGIPTSNRVRSSIGAYFVWLMTEGVVDANPITDIAKRSEGDGRTRVLTVPELVAILQATADGTDHDDIIWLLALTGARKSEIGGLTWEEIDLEAGVINIPGMRMKGGRAHAIPISSPVRTILQRRADRTGTLFGRTGERGFSGWSRSKARLDDKLADAGHDLKPWTVHDIRRSVSTHMTELLDVPPHIVAEILAHRTFRAGVEATYNRSAYAMQKKAALERWADLLTNVVEGRTGAVVPMARSSE